MAVYRQPRCGPSRGSEGRSVSLTQVSQTQPEHTSYGWRIGSLAGRDGLRIPVFIGRSWFIVSIVMVAWFGGQIGHPTDPEAPAVYGYLVAGGYVLALLFSVLVHEAAHALTARSRGYHVNRIVADLWGGHTVYEAQAPRPGTSALIAVAGPASNAVLAVMGYAVWQVVSTPTASLLVGAFTISNAFVTVFNLLPGHPLDGGFLLEAAVWKVTGDRNKGLIVAGWTGRVAVVAGVGWVIAGTLADDRAVSAYDLVWVALIAFFVWQGATRAIRVGQARRRLAQITLADVVRPIATISFLASARSVPASGSAPAVVALDPHGAPVGLVDLSALATLDPARLDEVPVASLVVTQPAGWLIPRHAATDLSALIGLLAKNSISVGVLVDERGLPVGSVDLDDIAARLSALG